MTLIGENTKFNGLKILHINLALCVAIFKVRELYSRLQVCVSGSIVVKLSELWSKIRDITFNHPLFFEWPGLMHEIICNALYTADCHISQHHQPHQTRVNTKPPQHLKVNVQDDLSMLSPPQFIYSKTWGKEGYFWCRPLLLNCIYKTMVKTNNKFSWCFGGSNWTKIAIEIQCSMGNMLGMRVDHMLDPSDTLARYKTFSEMKIFVQKQIRRCKK